jgi:dephospho-CoA kinase
MDAEKLVVGLAGMPGSGKSIVVDIAREMGYDVVVMGDVVRQETLKRGLELTPQNVGNVMLELRNEGGNSVIAQRCIEKIKQQISSKVLVDGLRSLSETELFSKHFTKFSIVAVHASPQTRFARLVKRGRSDDAAELKVFRERDSRELGVGLGNVIAMAEQLIINDDDLEKVKANSKASLEKIEQKWK